MKSFFPFIKNKPEQTIDLWLDDERDPADPFIQNKFGAHATDLWVKTSIAAIKMIDTGTVRGISFDHDLGGEDDGYKVAHHIEQAAFFNKIPKMQWWVHSANPAGKVRIVQAMQSADRFWSEKAV